MRSRVVLAVLVSLVFLALGVSEALYRSTLTATNAGGDVTSIGVPFEFSGQALVDGGFITSTTLNASITNVFGNAVASMPAGAKLDVKGAAADDGGVFTDETAEATSATADDMALLPAGPEVGDAYYFGFDFQGRILTLDVGRAGIGTWTLTWEYYKGEWSALSDVVDKTEGFTVAGTSTVSYTCPRDWIQIEVATTTAYWIRARVSAYTDITTQPLGTRALWESGLWWTFVDSLDADEQKQYTLNLGGPNMVTNQQIFVGDGGISTTDDEDLEPGSSGFFMTTTAFLDTSIEGDIELWKYWTENGNIFVNLGTVAGNQWVGQVLEYNPVVYLTTASVRLRQDTAAGTVYCRVRNVTTTILATSVTTYEAGDLTSDAGGLWYDFTFNPPYLLDAESLRILIEYWGTDPVGVRYAEEGSADEYLVYYDGEWH